MDGPRAAGRTRRTTGRGGAPAPRGVRRRGSGTVRRPDRSRIGWSRRIGVGLALVALGGTIVLAGSGALDSDARRASPSPPITATPPGATPTAMVVATLDAPVIEGAPTVLTRESRWILTVALPQSVTDRRFARLHVYRGDRLVAGRRLRSAERIRVGVPLKRGANRLTAAISGPDGAGPRSTEVVVTRDDVAPRLSILGPPEGRVINGGTATISGTSEPGTTVTVRNPGAQSSADALVGSSGTFELAVQLERGSNTIDVRSVDPAGNTASDTIFLTGGDGQPLAQLTMSTTFFKIARLPATISIQVTVIDADGAPVDGAPVVFSLSPPGLPASTYRSTTSDGAASWNNVTVPAEGATAGQGLATVQVTLDDGTIVRESVPFRFR